MSKIRRSRGLVVASKVITALEKLLVKSEVEGLHVASYSNGREQGLAVIGFDLHFSIAEYRRSDQIVIYSGRPTDFSMQGNVPSEAVYSKAFFFDDEEYEKAARFVADRLREKASS